MDFGQLKKKALKLKENALKKAEEAVSYGAEKLGDSGFTLKEITQFTDFVALSKNKNWKNPETGEEKTFVKQAVAVFVEDDTDFQKKMLAYLPVLWVKSFAQNIPLKLVDSKMNGLDLASYRVQEIPSLVIFENASVKKVITGEKNIEKVVKSASLDINKTIETL